MMRRRCVRLIPAALAVVFLTAGCDDDAILTEYTPVVVKPDVSSPRVEAPTVRERDAWVDQFHQRDAALDILWVVDITASMSDHIGRIQDNFQRFVDTLISLELDFQLGVTTTDVTPEGGGGRLIGEPPVLTPQDDIRARFIERVNMPFEIGAEEGLESARQIVSSPQHGFPRDDAMLAVILLTDADDVSHGSTGFFVRYFLGSKGPGNEDLVRVSAIAGDVPDGCVSPGYENVYGAGANPARRIHQVVSATRGVFGSVCAFDYGPTLDEIGLESAGLRRVFPLSHRAIPDQIVVLVNEQEVDEHPDTGWAYDEEAQSIRFDGDYLPPAGSVIHVRYRVRG